MIDYPRDKLFNIGHTVKMRCGGHWMVVTDMPLYPEHDMVKCEWVATNGRGGTKVLPYQAIVKVT